MKLRQFRFVHVGVVAAIGVAGLVSVGLVRAEGPAGTASALVPIVPCRLIDTRAGADNVGPRSTPLTQTETVTFAVTGTNGNCIIPSTATGIATNATAVNPTAASYVTIFPADAPRPTASNLNVIAGSPPTPNQVTVGLSADGKVSAYNNGGTLDLIIDVVGYYVPSTSGPAGPAGPPGPPGPAGTSAPSPQGVVLVATNGTHPAVAGGTVPMFASVREALASITDNDVQHPYLIKIAPGTYTESGPIDLKSYVDLEGAGKDTTTIACTCGGSTQLDGSSAVVRSEGALVSEVRNLGIVNNGGGQISQAIWTHSSTSTLSFLHVTAISQGATVDYGMYNSTSSPTLNGVNAIATGGSMFDYGIVNYSSSPKMVNLTVIATGGTQNIAVVNSGSAVAIDSSFLDGSTGSVFNTTASKARLSNTMIYGPITGPGATCVNVYNVNYDTETANCPAP